MLPETGFIRRYVFTRKLSGLYRRKGKGPVLRTLSEDDRLSRLNFDFEETVNQIETTAMEVDIERYLYTVLSDAHCNGCNWIGDKDPRLIEIADSDITLIRDSYHLIIERDPRDVLASRKKAAWSRGRIMIMHLVAMRIQFKGLEKAKKASCPGVISVRYENLISNPESVLTSVCENLGLEFDTSMLNFSRESAKLVNQHELQWKKETMGPLLRDNSGRWVENLNQLEVLVVEKLFPNHLYDGLKAPVRQLGVLLRIKIFIIAYATIVISESYTLSRKVFSHLT